MDVSLCFDTEDYTSPEKWGMDDIPKWLSEIMTEEDVVGSFLVIGHKARSLRERKRTDVIAAMRKHEIGLHTNFGSDHPTLTEALAPLEWKESMKHALEREGPGYRDLEAIFRTNIGSFSAHGASQTASMHAVAGRSFDRPWLYSFATGEQDLCWYADCFQFTGKGLGINEASYSNPDAVTRTLEKWEQKVPELIKSGHRWACIFMAHPLMIRCKQFNDALNYADGKNRWPWRTPEIRTAEEMKIAKTQFRRVVRWIKNHPDLNVLPLYESFRKYGKRKRAIGRSELAEFVAKAVTHQSIPVGFPFSPAEGLLAMAEDVAARKLAPRHAIRPVFGPTDESPRMPDNALDWLNEDALRTLAGLLLSTTEQSGHLPTALPPPGGTGRMGLPTIFHALAGAWNQLDSGKKSPRVRVLHICGRYPERASEVEARARSAWLNWPIHDLHMPLEKISRDARLQTWTWKSAGRTNDER